MTSSCTEPRRWCPNCRRITLRNLGYVLDASDDLVDAAEYETWECACSDPYGKPYRTKRKPDGTATRDPRYG